MSSGPPDSRHGTDSVRRRPTANAPAASACTAAPWTRGHRRCCRHWPCRPWPSRWPGCPARRWPGSSVATAVAQISPCRLTIVPHSIFPENRPPASPSTPGAVRNHFLRSLLTAGRCIWLGAHRIEAGDSDRHAAPGLGFGWAGSGFEHATITTAEVSVTANVTVMRDMNVSSIGSAAPGVRSGSEAI